MMKKKIEIDNKFVGEGEPCFVIAEAGVNHNGKLELAKKLIDIAVDAGVDAVKFQTWITEEIVTKDVQQADYQIENTGKKEFQYDMLKKLELSFDQFKELKKYADKKNIIFMSTPDDEKSVDFLYKIGIPAFKIGSGELTNDDMLEKISKKSLPIILSTGMANLEEISHAINTIKKSGNKKLMLLHCTSNYPTKINDVNLKAMTTLKEEFDLPVGYSDHTLGIDVSIAAVCLGARVIEKHFTIDKNLPGPDHKASIDHDELKKMVTEIRKIEKMSPQGRQKKMDSIKNIQKILGQKQKKPAKKELEIAKVVRKKIVAKKIIPKGARIQKNMITMKRAGSGLEPNDLEKVIGKYAKKTIKKDESIEIGDLK